jgi:hypothetical protein
MTARTRRDVLTALGTAAAGWPALRRGRGSNIYDDIFGAWLTGANELPPVETDAFGFAVFRVGPGEREIEYRLVVADIENAAESHVHKGPPNLNGSVVAYLFGPVREPVSKTGLLASGTLSDEDAIWPLTDAAELVDQMREENVYLNVHTTAHPRGEIRGQVRSIDD